MVNLTEVEDEHFQSNQAGPDVDEEDFTDTGSFPLQPISIACKRRLRPRNEIVI